MARLGLSSTTPSSIGVNGLWSTALVLPILTRLPHRAPRTTVKAPIEMRERLAARMVPSKIERLPTRAGRPVPSMLQRTLPGVMPPVVRMVERVPMRKRPETRNTTQEFSGPLMVTLPS